MAVPVDSRPEAAFAASMRALLDAGRPREAERIVRAALRDRPDDPGMLGWLSVCLRDQDRYGEAIAAATAAIAVERRMADLWLSLAMALRSAGRVREAVDAFRTCLALSPENAPAAAYQLGQALLSLGQWSEGWRLYEARRKMDNRNLVRLAIDPWSGEPPGRYVLVLRTDQGMGDALQFARFAGHLRQSGYPVFLWTREKLAPILRCVAGIGRVHGGPEIKVEGPPVKWAPLMSVPAMLGTTPETVPPAPYIAIPAPRVAAWRDRIGARGFRVGLCWQGSVTNENDRRRSLPLAALAPLAEIPGVRLVSLQKRPGAAQIGTVPFADRIEIVEDQAETGGDALLDTAAIIMNLDLVITVDTMTAHLAGALGRKVWTMLCFAPDWRWMLERTDTPWYPTMRLFRQEAPGDWHAVVAAVAARLRAELGA